MENIDVKYEDVLAWARSKDESTVVHTDGMDLCANCFFATYFTEKYAQPAYVGYCTLDVDSWDTWKQLPDWIPDAVQVFDDVGYLRGHIDAGEAVKILENLENKG